MPRSSILADVAWTPDPDDRRSYLATVEGIRVRVVRRPLAAFETGGAWWALTDDPIDVTQLQTTYPTMHHAKVAAVRLAWVLRKPVRPAHLVLQEAPAGACAKDQP